MSHKSELEDGRKLVASLGGTLNVTHQSGRLRGSAGIPDTIVQMGGKPTFFWEVKVGKDDLRPAQLDFLTRELDAVPPIDIVVGGVDALIAHLQRLGFRIL